MIAAGAATALEPLVGERRRALERFAADQDDLLARACLELARRFSRGGVLIPFGAGAAATDAAHAAVEFMHPVIVGKRALPALAPTNDPARAVDPGALPRDDDIALGLAHAAPDREVERFLERARSAGALTIAMLPAAMAGTGADFELTVESDDPQVVQEVQETAYHVLWELVHVFFEHPGLLDDACITCGDVAVEATVVAVEASNATIERDGLRERVATDLIGEVAVGDRLLCHAGVAIERLDAGPARVPDDPSGFLYPFLEARESDPDGVLADVRASTRDKASDTIALRDRLDLAAVAACGAELRERLERGGRLLAFGNGGSATDAQDLAADALARGWPGLALGNDAATVTAVANDVGFDKVFARQLIPLARPTDVAVAVTTSGNSANVLAGLERAHAAGMLTVALAGYDGGRLAELDWLDHLFVVGSDYIPRIQEAQATIYHLLLEAIGDGADALRR